MTVMRGTRPHLLGLVVAAAIVGATPLAHASDLYKPGTWAAMASDRLASRVGDSLTVLIYESSQAQNTSQSSRQGGIQASGQVGSSTVNHSGQLSATAGYSGNGQTGRTEQMIAQISVVVDAVLPNGDLHVVGEQALKINGQHTRIRLRGRVRREDISSLNTIRSSMVADAAIDYDGAPLGTTERRPGIARRVLGWFGIH